MKIVLPGGSGQIGQTLARAFVARGDEVVVLSRRPDVGTGCAVLWDGRTLGAWAEEIDGADVVINLAGRSVNTRPTTKARKEMLESRVDSTHVVGEAIARAARPPRVWLNASTATIYAHRYDAPNDEATGIIGGREPDVPAAWAFPVKLALAWEQAMNDAITPSTRKIALRTSLMMSPDRGGVFDVLLGLVRRGLGGKTGDGRQYVSWILDRDYVRAIEFLIARDDIEGPVNVTSPNPLPNRDFMAALREAWGIGVGVPATKWMLEIGALAMRTDSELVLKSRRVVPGKLLEKGFSFEVPEWPVAAKDLVERWKALS